MSGSNKKILISLPEPLIEEMDSIANQDHTNRSRIIREAIHNYIEEKRKSELRAVMKSGYLEMGKINLKIAEMCFETENIDGFVYEEKLSECE